MTDSLHSVDQGQKSQKYWDNRVLIGLLEESKSWDAAQALAAKFFAAPGSKFVTEFQYKRRWIVTQWVTTRSSASSVVVLAFPGRVGIARRRTRAFRLMAEGSWRHGEPEPDGLTIALRIFPNLGVQHEL